MRVKREGEGEAELPPTAPPVSPPPVAPPPPSPPASHRFASVCAATDASKRCPPTRRLACLPCAHEACGHSVCAHGKVRGRQGARFVRVAHRCTLRKKSLMSTLVGSGMM